MAYTHTHTYQLSDPDDPLAGVEIVSAEARISIKVAAAVAESNRINTSIDVSTVKSLVMICDQQVVVNTNSEFSPDDSITLKPNAPYVWTENNPGDLALTEDVTSLYIFNEVSGQVANFRLEALVDPTP